ncbi:TadE family protein [Qipengyuania sp. DSG2-2]|uniref:TadE family protein n=1 Tax=Qipengyuania sp. DGS2-2 TaxID=3349631 RepID=UPI0036D29289
MLIEFALIGPVVIGLMLGVLQVGVALQNYNAVRSAAADAARYAVVQYQAGNTPSDAQIETEAESIATSSPYFLKSDRLVLDVDQEATQSIAGAIEMTISATYTPELILPFFSWKAPAMTYERPIFVLDPTP